ncbi:MAG TPA: alpha-galactosidase [Terriglobales bacterium]|nr:alpha-galactosidase [Terriglobales bacterium]
MVKLFSRLVLPLVLCGSALCFAQQARSTLVDKVKSGAGFSFVYDGKPSREILSHWKKTESTKSLADGRSLHVTTYRDLATAVEVSQEITTFSESPAVECLLRIRNTGVRDTPILEKILPLDMGFDAAGTGKIVMHYARGGMGNEKDYLPVDDTVAEGTEVNLVHYILEGTQHVGGQLPFFNLEWQGGGLIGAVGWTGQWVVKAKGESGRGVHLEAGQQKTHLKLHPGESIRTPRILLLQWSGDDRFVGHNQFRKLLFAHYAPRVNGQVVEPPIGNSNAFDYQYEAVARQTGQNPLEVVSKLKPGEEKTVTSFTDAALNAVDEKNQLDFIRGIPPVGIELYWLDAGWFPGEWPFGVGTWDPDPKKFPHGLKVLGDAAHAKGLKFLLWFEPGRVGAGSLIATQHPEFVLHRPDEGKLGGLFNFGDPAALRWMTETLSSRIKQWGVDIYRQDSNICPLLFWQNADDDDRQGIAENRWVEGLYKLWDGLLRQRPGLMIDNANWRITGPDIEVMSRSVGSLSRSETECAGIPHPAATQVQTAELSLWTPLGAGTVNGFDAYTFRSAATSGTGAGLNLRASYIPLDQVQAGIAELKSLRPFWTGDYYPLTEIDLDEKNWAGWEFYRPDLKAGFAVFFRRGLSEQASLETSLRAIEPAAKYDVSFSKSYEARETREMTGEQLMHLRVESESKPESVLVRFRRR